MTKKIIIGDINESFKGTPLQIFNTARDISSSMDWEVKTNNPQFVEALEVLNIDKPDEIKIYLQLHGECNEIDFMTAYDYLGDLYNLIDEIRISQEILKRKMTDEEIDNGLQEYKEKLPEYKKKYNQRMI